VLALILWFLTFERLWEIGRRVTTGHGFEMAAAANALLLLALALLASWRMPLYPPH